MLRSDIGILLAYGPTLRIADALGLDEEITRAAQDAARASLSTGNNFEFVWHNFDSALDNEVGPEAASALVDHIAELLEGSGWPWYGVLSSLADRPNWPRDGGECSSMLRAKLEGVQVDDLVPLLDPIDATDVAIADWFGDEGARVYLLTALKARRIKEFFKGIGGDCLNLIKNAASREAEALGYPAGLLPMVTVAFAPEGERSSGSRSDDK